MALYKFSDKFVFNILSDIKIGYLEITNYEGQVYRLGNPQDNLKAKLKIRKPNFSFNLIKGGSIGFAESYICLLYTSPSPRDRTRSRMPSSA